MPARTIPLITNQIYHIFNKTQGDALAEGKYSLWEQVEDA